MLGKAPPDRLERITLAALWRQSARGQQDIAEPRPQDLVRSAGDGDSDSARGVCKMRNIGWKASQKRVQNERLSHPRRA